MNTLRKTLMALAMLLSGTVAFGQKTVFSGTGGSSNGYIYEDGMTDSGMRYIMSDVRNWNTYNFSICKFIPEEGDPWYGIAIESQNYIPQNGLLVFVCDNATEGMKTFVFGQNISDRAVGTRSSLSISPIFHFGSNSSSMSFATYRTTETRDFFFAIYSLSEEELLQLINSKVKEYRVSERSTYFRARGPFLSSMSKWMSESKQRVDTRSSLSINMILEDIK